MVEQNAVRVLTVLIKVALAALIVGLLLIGGFVLTRGGGAGTFNGMNLLFGGVGSIVTLWSVVALLILWLARLLVRRSLPKP